MSTTKKTFVISVVRTANIVVVAENSKDACIYANALQDGLDYNTDIKVGLILKDLTCLPWGIHAEDLVYGETRHKTVREFLEEMENK